MQLIPKLREDEYYWKGKVFELNPVRQHVTYKSRMIHYKPERCVLIPVDALIDKDFEVRVRNGVVRLYEKMLSQLACESDGWRLA